MKRIDTLIHPALWEQACPLFEALNVPVTVREVKTIGRSAPRREVYRGAAYYSHVSPELEITAIVAEAELEGLLSALLPLAQASEISVSTVEAEWLGRGAVRRVVAAEPATASWINASPLPSY